MASVGNILDAIIVLQAAANDCATLILDESSAPDFNTPLTNITLATTQLRSIAAGQPPLPDTV